jgi:hypothetical protein
LFWEEIMRNLFACAIAISLFAASLSACNARSAPTPDTQATVNAAVAATGTSQVSLKATVDAAVKATAAAAQPQPPTAAGAPTSLPTISAAAKPPTAAPGVAGAPSPTPVNTVTLSEEELAALIDQSVAKAVAATQASSSATSSATADGTLTTQELAALLIYAANADRAIAYAEELINSYYGLYAELAAETIAVLQAIEQDLSAMSASVDALNATLAEINKTLAQGVAIAEQTIAKLNTAAKTASDKAAQAQAKAQSWAKGLPSTLDKRAAAALGVKPTQVATDRQGALLSAFDYVDAVRQATGDNKLSKSELTQIAQLGANASAGLKAQGGPGLQTASGSIDKLTGQLARGQVPQAKAGLGSLESSLGARPSRPSRP